MAASEAVRPDGVEAEPDRDSNNHIHFPFAKALLQAGVDVIRAKPLSTSMVEANELADLTRTPPAHMSQARAHHCNDGGFAPQSQALLIGWARRCDTPPFSSLRQS